MVRPVRRASRGRRGALAPLVYKVCKARSGPSVVERQLKLTSDDN